MEQKNKPGNTHTHTKNIEYKHLCIQEYLMEGNMNTELSKTLEIKSHEKMTTEN